MAANNGALMPKKKQAAEKKSRINYEAPLIAIEFRTRFVELAEIIKRKSPL